MPKMNIDEIAKAVCEPIEVTVGGKDYTIIDIPLSVTKKMNALGDAATGDIDTLIGVVAEIFGAKAEDIGKLGMRKLLLLVRTLMDEVNKEAEAKNAPKAEVKTLPK